MDSDHHDEKTSELSEYADLTEFQRDVLIVVAGLSEPHGLKIKEELEKYYPDTVHHGRLYPNLDTLEQKDLVEKFEIDSRSNGYRLTTRGANLLEKRQRWLSNRIGIGIDDQMGKDKKPQSNDKNSDAEGFQFGPSPESAIDEDWDDLPSEQQTRLLDLFNLEPTSNSELKEKWGMASGSEVHNYLDSMMKQFYFRDEDSYIRLTEEGKELVQENNDRSQYVPRDSGDSEDESQNIRNRDLLMDLISVAQSTGNLPDENKIERHSTYSADRFREEFGSLFKACQQAGIVPDSVTKNDYLAAVKAKKDSEESQPGAEETVPEPSGPSRSELLEELQWIDEEVEGIPYPSDMNESGMFTPHAYQEEFGSWDEALAAAGIDKEKQLLEDMKRVAEEVGEDMTQPQMNELGRYSASMAVRFFGSWIEAKKRFQEWSEEKEEEEDSSGEFEQLVNERLDDILE